MVLCFPSVEYYWTVVVNHVPLPIVELVNICHIKRTRSYIDMDFHGNPSNISQHTSTYILELKVESLFPVECKLPTANNCIVPVEETG